MANPTQTRFFIEQLTIDPTQYKPYSHTLKPVGALVVELPVNPEDVVEYSAEDDVLVIDLDGFKALLSVVADAVEDAHIERKQEQAQRASSTPTIRRTRIVQGE